MIRGVSVRALLFAVACAALLAFVITKPTPVAPVPRSDSFAKRFDKMVTPVVQVRTIPIVAPAPQPPPEPPQQVTVAAVLPAAPPPRRAADSDICRRHKMHKVYIDKYRWRCRR